uniref:Chitin-binding type-2 domain-containing protein n=1 Tax=Heterorhabditis bacteriophora TaxID=37862 RepID=A0A1I7W853_HETBA
MNGRCLAARNFEECREVLMNTVNEETLQFVEQDAFCSNGAGVYRGENGEMFDACSRQALICHPNRRNSVAIFCPERSSITQLLTCIDAPKYCHDSLELIAPIRQFFLERLCNSKNALIGKFQQFHSNGMGQCTSCSI